MTTTYKKVDPLRDYPVIKAMFEAGKSRREIAELLGFKYHVVCRVLHDYGLQSKKWKPKRNLDFYSDDYTG